MSNFVKQPLIISLSIFINVLLFLLIYQLVSNEIISLPQFKELNWLDYIRLEHQTVRDDKTEKILPDEPPPPEKTPAPPELAQPDIPKPQQINIDIPTPNIDVPLGVTGTPYLGDFLKTPPPVDTKPVPPALDIAVNLVPTTRVEPVYPPRALRAGIEGSVTAEFTIDTDGLVKDVEIIRADPPRIFDRAVIAAIAKWKFTPEIIDGVAVEKRARQDIKFTLK